MSFDLEADVANRRRQTSAGYIKIASKMIAQCPDPVKRAKAIAELQKLQRNVKR